MMEHLKTTLLWFLILLSVYLTFQIWTFQPTYGVLKNTEYIDHTQIGEEKKLKEVIQPSKMIIFDQGNAYSAINQMEFVNDFIAQFNTLSLDYYSLLTDIEKENELSTGMEFIFPGPVPIDALKEFFSMSINGSDNLIHEVDSLTFYYVEATEQVRARFVSYREKVAVETITNMVSNKFIEFLTVIENEEFHDVFSYELTNYGNGFAKRVFLPKKELEVEGVTYLARNIPTEHFKQSLFSDPNFVKNYMQSNGEESFTDGNRMVNIVSGGNILRYINPSFGDLIDRNNKHLLFSSLDFLNGHGGLTNTFYYDTIKTFGSSEEIIFRLMIDGIPVYGSNLVNNLFEITLARSNGAHIEQYARPLFYLEEDPVDITKSVQLPSGLVIKEFLEKKDEIEPYLLKDINFGYKMVKRQSFIVFEPSWFIHYNGTWQSIEVIEESPDSEAIGNGLE